jgi:hypothetical protein
MSNVRSQSDRYEIGDSTPVFHNPDLVGSPWT